MFARCLCNTIIEGQKEPGDDLLIFGTLLDWHIFIIYLIICATYKLLNNFKCTKLK